MTKLSQPTGPSSPVDALELAAKVDNFVLEARRESWLGTGGSLERFEASNQASEFNLTSFAHAYIASGRYPVDRLLGVIYRLIDVKLQLEYVTIDLGTMNMLYFAPIVAGIPATSPRLTLRRMAFEQSIIGRIRIAWEKLMRTIYYLEKGSDLESKRSFKGRFFDWLAEYLTVRPEWRFLLPYEQEIEQHDSKFRTPEYHKNSIIRSHVTGVLFRI